MGGCSKGSKGVDGSAPKGPAKDAAAEADQEELDKTERFLEALEMQRGVFYTAKLPSKVQRTRSPFGV